MHFNAHFHVNMGYNSEPYCLQVIIQIIKINIWNYSQKSKRNTSQWQLEQLYIQYTLYSPSRIVWRKTDMARNTIIWWKNRPTIQAITVPPPPPPPKKKKKKKNLFSPKKKKIK